MDSEAGFLGLGAMGRGMVERLAGEGVRVTAWNRSAGPAEELADRLGTRAADTPEAVFAAAPVVHSMLADDEAVLAVFDDGLLASVPEGRVHVNHATISPAAAGELAERHAAHGVGYVQAPVLGRSTIASTGALLVVVSGDPAAVEAATPTLERLGQRTWNLGADPRMASIVKIAVNYSIVNALQSIGESVVLVESAGIDPQEFVEILTHTAFSGSVHRGYGPLIAGRRYRPVGFSMALGLKDLSLAEGVADAQGVTLPIAPVLRELFEAALADPGLRELDWAAVAEVTRARSRTHGEGTA
ncbi:MULTISPECIES: NAD(P)-dependent oxidoreductase [unclassified Agromyces]|uniref:NAD(P)-dependent oxidoreductase n=1 Tax=unclassified Agromyces TaxID=2639701 RepID=UPI0030152FDB